MAEQASLVTPTPVTPVGADHFVLPVSLPAGAGGLTSGIDLKTRRLSRIAIPSGWITATSITFQTSVDGVTFYNLYDSIGTEYAVTVAASRSVLVPLIDFIGIRYIKIRSGTAAAAVNQTGSPVLQLVCLK